MVEIYHIPQTFRFQYAIIQSVDIHCCTVILPAMLLIRWLGAIIALPGTFLVLIPWGILRFTRGATWHASLVNMSNSRLLIVAIIGICGLGLAVWTCSLFFRFGKGTAAPWDPPQRLVIRGPYRHVRNPMLTGVWLLLLCEVIVFQSWGIFVLLLIFVLVNMVYLPLVEERALEKRFGQDYVVYKQHVPRWIPRFTAWPR